MQRKMIVRCLGISVMLWQLNACADSCGQPAGVDSGVPDPEGNDGPRACNDDSNCFNGEHCENGLCEADSVADDAGEPGLDAAVIVDAGDTASGWEFRIRSPGEQSGHFARDQIEFRGSLVGPQQDASFEGLAVQWINANDLLHMGHDAETGDSDFTTQLAPGHHVVTAYVFDIEQNFNLIATDSVEVFICDSGDLEGFDNPLDEEDWYIHVGDRNMPDVDREVWHPDGYLLLSEGISNHSAVIQTARQFTPGDLHLSFLMNMGRCAVPEISCSGFGEVADGFAISIFNLETPEEVIEMIQDHTSPGGGLGYQLRPSLTDGHPPPEVEAFHLEFDVYYNHTSRGHLHDDPTNGNHIQVLFNANMDNDLDPDPNNEVTLWSEVPQLVDNQWHEMVVDVSGTDVRVSRDGIVLMEGSVPAYSFKGGWMVLTATTGAVGMYQRLDDLDIMESCQYQSPDE